MKVIIGVLLGILVTVIIYRMIDIRKKRGLGDFERIFQLAEKSRDVIYYCEVKPEMKYKYISPSLDLVLGEGTVEEAYRNPHSAFDLIHPHDYGILQSKVSGEIDFDKPVIQRWRDKEGNYKWFEEYTCPVYENGELKALHGIIRNIDNRKETELRLMHRIYRDALTGTYNRLYFEEQMEKYDKHTNLPVSIIVIDLDDLKKWNDTLGHAKGDELIKQTAEILKSFASERLTISRIGGDEFVLIGEAFTDMETTGLIRTIFERLDASNEKNGTSLKLSVGGAASPHSKGFMDCLFQEADQKMYAHKKSKKKD